MVTDLHVLSRILFHLLIARFLISEAIYYMTILPLNLIKQVWSTLAELVFIVVMILQVYNFCYVQSSVLLFCLVQLLQSYMYIHVFTCTC